QDENVFDVERRPGEKTGISLQEDRISHRSLVAISEGQPGLVAWAAAKGVFDEPAFGLFIRRRKFFEFSQRYDEVQERRSVRTPTPAQIEGFRSGSRLEQ